MGQTYAYAPVEDLILPQGITLPKTYTVRDKNGAVVNVTGGAVRMTFRGRYGGTALLNCVCSVVSGPSGDVQCVAEAADTAAVTRARGRASRAWGACRNRCARGRACASRL